jgi:uncharacterized protein YjiS (DUF1127 family)
MTAICSETAAGRVGRSRASTGARLLAAFGVWHRRARQRAELAGLSDRVLADIGLSRAEAEFLANKPFWRE